MKPISILTPEQSGYYDDDELDEILINISKLISNKKFKFVPENFWIKRLSDINKSLESFGWEIRSEWDGDRESGHSVWKLLPHTDPWKNHPRNQ